MQGNPTMLYPLTCRQHNHFYLLAPHLSFTGIKPDQVLLCRCVQILAGFTVQVVSVWLLSSSSAEEGNNVHNKNVLMNIGRGHRCNSGEPNFATFNNSDLKVGNQPCTQAHFLLLACRRKEPGNIRSSSHRPTAPGIWWLQSDCRKESCGYVTI